MRNKGERVRRIGVLTTLPENDLVETARNAMFRQSLEQIGWIAGRNVQIEVRRSLGDAERARRLALELISLACRIAHRVQHYECEHSADYDFSKNVRLA